MRLPQEKSNGLEETYFDRYSYMKYIDEFLNKITMYRLVLYGLAILSFISLVFGFVGLLPYSGLSQLGSLIIILLSCFITNFLLSKFFNVQTNIESVWISSYILFFILSPITSVNGISILILASVLAMASKYFFVIKKAHVFNPVAISVFILGLFGSGAALWWVGNSYLFIPTLILGFLIVKKILRTELFFAFLVSSVLSSTIFSIFKGFSLSETFISNFVSGPLIFFGTVMLTEPATTPGNRKLRIYYGVIAGLLFGFQFSIGSLYSTPELALVVANLYSFLVFRRIRVDLELVEKNKLTNDIYEFVWKTKDKINFEAGQYLEWTLPHRHPDNRGNRRYFTISTSPTEENIRLGIKFYDHSSSFKTKLVSMEPGDKIVGSNLAGDFTLTKDQTKKIVFIAGGIGITPFRSMVKYFTDKKENRDVVLLFSNKTSKDVVYLDVFNSAKESGLKTINFVGSISEGDTEEDFKVGMINEEVIKKEVPDYIDRIFYISGPPGMVSAFEATLKKMSVPRKNIMVDFFPGYS